MWNNSIALWSHQTNLYPNDVPEAFYNHGLAYCHAGKYKKAIQSFLTAVSLKPDYVDAYTNLGLSYYSVNPHGGA